MTSNMQNSIISDFSKLFEDKKLSDVTLVANDGKEVQAHKLVLAARSKVFAAMFDHDTQEQKLNRVEITDLDYDTLSEMLRYMYTDHVPKMDEVAPFDLLFAADKYELYGLKLLCEESLFKKLSVDTAVDTLLLAELHAIPKLKTHAIAFITTNNAIRIAETEGWKNMIRTHPHLAWEVFRTFVLKMQNTLPAYLRPQNY